MERCEEMARQFPVLSPKVFFPVPSSRHATVPHMNPRYTCTQRKNEKGSSVHKLPPINNHHLQGEHFKQKNAKVYGMTRSLQYGPQTPQTQTTLSIFERTSKSMKILIGYLQNNGNYCTNDRRIFLSSDRTPPLPPPSAQTYGGTRATRDAIHTTKNKPSIKWYKGGPSFPRRVYKKDDELVIVMHPKLLKFSFLQREEVKENDNQNVDIRPFPPEYSWRHVIEDVSFEINCHPLLLPLLLLPPFSFPFSPRHPYTFPFPRSVVGHYSDPSLSTRDSRAPAILFCSNSNKQQKKQIENSLLSKDEKPGKFPSIRLWTKLGVIKSLYTANVGARKRTRVEEEDIRHCDNNRLVEIPCCNHLTFSHGCPNENQIIFIERCEKVEMGGRKIKKRWSHSDKTSWKGEDSGSDLKVGKIIDSKAS